MRKVPALATLILVVAIVAGVGILVVRNIDGIVKEMIEVVGSQVTGSRVRVAGLKIDLSEGVVSVSGLTVANPKGFSDRNIFSLGNIIVDIETGSLSKNVYVIELISIDGILVFAEQVGSTNNIQALLQVVHSGAEPGGLSSEGVSVEILLAVNEISFRDASVSLDSDLFGETSLKLPDFSVYDLGTPTEGLTPKQLASAITMRLAFKAKDRVAKELRELAKQKAISKIKQKIGERTLEGVEKLQRLFGRDR